MSADQNPSMDRLDERLDQFDARFDRFEAAMGRQIDRLDASINGRFGRVEKRVSDIELELARLAGARDERDRLGVPPAAPPAPPSPGAAAGPEVSETWLPVRARITVAYLGAATTAIAAVGVLLEKL